MNKRKKLLSWVLTVVMLLSLMTALPMTASAAQPPAVVFTDDDLDNVYFAGDTLAFNLTGLPVGTSPAEIPAGTMLRVSLGIVNASGAFSDLQLLESLSNGSVEGTGFYVERTLNADGSLSADISGVIASAPMSPGIAAVKLYAHNGSAWQNVMQGQTPDYILLSSAGQPATVGLDGVLQMPPGVTSVPVLGSGTQDAENLRALDISFSKTIAAEITGSIEFTGLNLLDSTAQSQLNNLNAGLIMEQIPVPAPGTIEQYTMGVDVSGALSFLAGEGATVSLSSPSFNGLSTAYFQAVAAGVAGGAVSNLSFNDATDTVSFDVNHFSSYTLSVVTPKEIFFENFEGYETQIYPASFTKQRMGTGDIYQAVISATGYNGLRGKFFQLQGTNLLPSEQYVALPASLPEVLVADAYIKPRAGYYPGKIAFRNLGGGPWGTNTAAVWFIDNKISAYNSELGQYTIIGNYTWDEWHKVTIELDVLAKTYNVYINGELAAINVPAHPSLAPTTLFLIAGYTETLPWTETSTIWFDNVGIYSDIDNANHLPSATNVSIDGNAVVGETLTGKYDFNANANGGPEAGSTFRWLADGSESLIFNTNNIAGVFNNPSVPAAFTITENTVISKISNYHWNHGQGKEPGTIALQEAGGTLYGPWNAVGKFYEFWEAPLYWEVTPYVELPPGTYTIIDSSHETWAHNSQSGNRGMTQVFAKTYSGTYSVIPDATDSTYVLTADDLGKRIKFEVAVRDSRGTAGMTEESAAVGPVAYATIAPPASDSTLSSLSASEITLTPAFSKDVINYSANVANSISRTRITAVPTDSTSTVEINGEPGTSRDIDLNAGSNTITVLVTAEDLTTTTYTISINRAAASSGIRSTPTAPAAVIVTTKITDDKTTNKTEINAGARDGTTEADITTPMVDALLQKANETGGTDKKDFIETKINTLGNLQKLDVTISQTNLARIAAQTDASLSLTSPFASIAFDGKALETIAGANSGGKVLISASLVDKTALSEKNRERVKDRPVYDFSVYNSGTQVTNFGGGKATVSVPYTLQPGENPRAVVIYYLSDDGTLKTVRGSYNAKTGSVIFITPHFSMFVVGYNQVSFKDVLPGAWYKNAVDFVAAREITSGTGDNQFSPEAKLTRAQFVVLLMNTYQINPQNQGTSSQIQNFTDAGSTYYTDYLLAAKALGIVKGVGNNLFAPEKEITRQEMFVMLYNALKVIDETPTATVNKELSAFSDAGQVADWAREALSDLVEAGIITGSNNKLNPASSATRAEITQVLYNLLFK